METNDAPRPLDDLLGAGSVIMLGTADDDGRWAFRPLTAARVHGSRMDVLVDTTEEWVAGIDAGSEVHVTVSDTKANTWADLRGRVDVSTDRDLVDELWSPPAAAYFDDGRDTPGIGAMMIDVSEGRYWSAPSGRLGSLLSMAEAMLGDPEEDAGDHGEVATS